MAAILVIASVPVAAYGSFAAYALLRPPVESYLHSVNFDAEGWKQRTLDGDAMWPTRLRMIDDLMTRRLLDGQPRTAVERLLGPADRTDYFRDWDMVYHLGPERGFIRIDSEWLVIRLDRGGNVVESRVARD